MLALPIVVLCVACLFLTADATQCSKDIPADVEVDCTTALMDCPHYSSRQTQGMEIGPIENPAPNHRSSYRTCFDIDGNCRATLEEDTIPIETIVGSTDFSLETQTTLQILTSSNFFNSNKPKYLKSSITRYNVKCDDGKQIQYSFVDHDLEESTKCDSMPDICIDFVRLNFPTYNTPLVTCGSMNELDDLDNLIGLDGMSEINIEFVTNRATQGPGFRLYVYCRNPAFDSHFIDPDPDPASGRKRRNIEICTSPNGFGPRDEPYDPPPALRIQDVLDRDDTALFGMLEVGENLTYANNTVMLSNGTSFEDITCLTVENRIQTKTLSGSSTGYYGGFAQIAVSFQLQKVVMVQFGVRPIFQPTEQEAIFIGLLETGIIEVLVREDEEQLLELEDEIDVFPRFGIPIPRFDTKLPRSRRGVDRSFLDRIAIEFGNACNGALRSAACHYQDLILNRNCLASFEGA